MIEAGEDPRFIARRIMISAAEDIGMADPQALPIAVAAADAVALIGMPEGRIPLAEAVVYLATAPKSNAVVHGARRGDRRRARRQDRPRADAPARRALPGREAPRPRQGLHLLARLRVRRRRRSSTCPTSSTGTEYYEPTSHGNERDVAARLEKIRRDPARRLALIGCRRSVRLDRLETRVFGHLLVSHTHLGCAPTCAPDRRRRRMIRP